MSYDPTRPTGMANPRPKGWTPPPDMPPPESLPKAPEPDTPGPDTPGPEPDAWGLRSAKWRTVRDMG